MFVKSCPCRKATPKNIFCDKKQKHKEEDKKIRFIVMKGDCTKAPVYSIICRVLQHNSTREWLELLKGYWRREVGREGGRTSVGSTPFLIFRESAAFDAFPSIRPFSLLPGCFVEISPIIHYLQPRVLSGISCPKTLFDQRAR